MRKRFVAAVFTSCILCLSASAQEITLQDAARLAVENDLSVQLAARGLSTAENAYELLKASVKPQITASDAPSYVYTTPESFDTSGPLPVSTVVDVHSVSVGLGLIQALPTDGTVTASISNTTAFTKSGTENSVAQSPSFTVALSQPLFINGKVIDFDLFQARKDTQGRIPISKAASQEIAARNGAAIAAVASFTAIVELRSRLSFLERNIAIAKRDLELVRIRADQGGVTLRDVWEAELAIETLQEQLLELKFSLLETEQLLERSTGGGVDISQAILRSDIPMISHSLTVDSVLERAMSASSDIVENSLTLEDTKKKQIISGRTYASDLTVAVTLEPRYALDSDTSDDFSGSVAGLFDEGAYLAPTISVGMSIPVYQGGQKKYQQKIDEDSRYIAELNLANSRKRVADTVNNLFLRREMLTEKLNFVSQSYALELERLQDRQRLFELKSITELDLTRSQLTVDEKKLDVWRTQADMFNNALEILMAAGYDLEPIIEGK